MNFFSLDFQLDIYAGLNVLMFIITLIFTISCFSHTAGDGLYRAMAYVSACGAIYHLVNVFFWTVDDVLSYPHLTTFVLIRNTALFGVVLSVCWAGWKLLRHNE